MKDRPGQTPATEAGVVQSDPAQQVSIRDAAKKAALLLASGAALMLPVASEHDTAKPEGPYAAHADAFDREASSERIPAAPELNNIAFSNTLDDLLASAGYTVFVDREKLATSLKPGNVAVVTQTTTGPKDEETGEPIVSKIGMRVDAAKTPAGALSTEQQDVLMIPPDLTVEGVGSISEMKGVLLPDRYVPMGGSLDPHSASPAIIDVSVYDLSNGGATKVSSNTVTATIRPTVESGDPAVPPFASEVALTPKQHETVRIHLGRYAVLLPQGSSVRLDSVGPNQETQDAANRDSGTVLLTYPYKGSAEVSDKELRSVMIHEFLHRRYNDADAATVKMATDTYQYMVAQMKYQMPPEGTEGRQVADAEPVWGIITELKYPGADSEAGHPWRSPTEMTSSTAAVLATNPEEFLERFQHLSSKERRAVYGAVLATGKLIATSGRPVEEIIPEYQNIVGTLQREYGLVGTW